MNTDRQQAFTFIEVVLTMAIILILVGAMLAGGKYLKVQGQRQLTQSAIEVIVTAMEQYYDEYRIFPFVTVVNFGQTDYTVVPTLPLPGSVVGGTTEEKQKNGDSFSNASSAALYYFLDQNKDCRQIIESLVPGLITNKDAQTGALLTINITINGAVVAVDLPRFVDVWGTSLRYEYMSGYSFPVITSAGPDKIFSYPGPDNIFGTADDIESADNLSSR